MTKSSRGLTTGLILGILFAVLALGLYLWAPDFKGFIDRSSSQQSMPIWNLFLLLALVNFIYAGISHFLQRKLEEPAQKQGNPDEQG